MIEIGIVDDHAIVRAALRQFLSEQVDLRVAGEASDGVGALNLICQKKITVLVLDLAMPGKNGIEMLPLLKSRDPKVGILVLSGYPEAHYATDVLRLGANGYLGKDCDPMQIVDAIRVISLGQRYITPSVAELLAQQLERKNAMPHTTLSPREYEIFMRLAQGGTSGEIAQTLSLSIKSVSTYRSRVLEKLNFATNSEMTYYALKNHLIV